MSIKKQCKLLGVAVVGEPVLNGFEQISWEVILLAFEVALLCDVFESLGEGG